MYAEYVEAVGSFQACILFGMSLVISLSGAIACNLSRVLLPLRHTQNTLLTRSSNHAAVRFKSLLLTCLYIDCLDLGNAGHLRVFFFASLMELLLSHFVGPKKGIVSIL